MLVEFDKLKRVCSVRSILDDVTLMPCFQDYQEHQNEIHAKLVAIMGDRLSAHIKTLQVIVDMETTISYGCAYPCVPM
jgi:vacuolar protein sorting-associated protein 54